MAGTCKCYVLKKVGVVFATREEYDKRSQEIRLTLNEMVEVKVEEDCLFEEERFGDPWEDDDDDPWEDNVRLENG